MKKKIEVKIKEEVKACIDELLNTALKAARRGEEEYVVFCLAEARKLASEIKYDINKKISEVVCKAK